MMFSNSIFKKWVSAFVAVVMFFNFQAPSAWSETALPVLKLPEHLGRVTNISSADAHSKIVYLIQDAHTSLEAQFHIRDLIGHLKEKEKIKTVLFEGAAHPLSPEIFHFYRDAQKQNTFLENLLNAGELTGGELALFDSKTGKPNALRGQGMEDADEFVRNLKAARSLIRNSPGIEKALEKLEQARDKKWLGRVSKELEGLIRRHESFRRGQTDWFQYLAFLNDSAKSSLKLDLTNPRYQFEYPMLVRVALLKNMEKQIKPEETEKDRSSLVSWLKAKGFADWALKIESNKIETGNIRSELEQLYSQAAKKGLNFESYPAWSHWMGLKGLEQELDANLFEKEMKHLFKQLINKTIQNVNDRDYVHASQKLWKTHDLLELKLSRSAWQKLNADHGPHHGGQARATSHDFVSPLSLRGAQRRSNPTHGSFPPVRLRRNLIGDPALKTQIAAPLLRQRVLS